MARVAFDTLAYANKLKAAGADQKLAEMQAEATAEILTSLVDDQLATKQDVQAVKQDLQVVKQDIQTVKEELKMDIKNLEMRLHAVFFKMISIAVAILGGLQTLFHFMK